MKHAILAMAALLMLCVGAQHEFDRAPEPPLVTSSAGWPDAIQAKTPGPALHEVAETAAVPIDLAARAKFPREVAAGRAGNVDAIAFINAYVNAHMIPVSDQEHYGLSDFWAMAPGDAKGDCEDYALTKLFMLERAGVPVVSSMKLVGVFVHEKDGAGKEVGEGHAILAVRFPSGAVAYLDNRFREPMTRRELAASGYEFFDWRA